MAVAAVPGVKQFAVVGLDPHLVDAVGGEPVILWVPTDDRLARRAEELDSPEDAPRGIEGEECRSRNQNGERCSARDLIEW